MKKIFYALFSALIFCAVAFPVQAQPQDPPPVNWNGTLESYRQHRAELACRAKGNIFRMATDIRDQGSPPEAAYNIAAGGWLTKEVGNLAGINKEFIKKAINKVYFDPDFINAGGPLFERQVYDNCMNGGKPKFQPLK